MKHTVTTFNSPRNGVVVEDISLEDANGGGREEREKVGGRGVGEDGAVDGGVPGFNQGLY